MLAAGVELVWLADGALLLLPQPEPNAPPAIATINHVDSFRFISHPNRWKGSPNRRSRVSLCAFFAFGFLEGLLFGGFFAFKALLCGFPRGLFGNF